MKEEIKELLAQEIKKYLLIGAGIILGCMLIGVAVITAIAGGEDAFSDGGGNSGGGGANINATLSPEDIQNVNSMITFANALEGYNFSAVREVFGDNESMSFTNEWCSWFCWNLYYRYGFVGETWNSSYSENKLPTTGEGDFGFNWACGWMATPEDAYVGYIQNTLYPSEAVVKAYVPQPGDLVLFSTSDYSGFADHVGMVTAVSEGQVTTIEGNTGNGGSPSSRQVSAYPWSVSGGISDYIGTVDSDWDIIGYYSLATHQERNKQ